MSGSAAGPSGDHGPELETGRADEPGRLVDRLGPSARGDRTLAFTAGDFELLLPGHLELFRRGRALADRLVVAVHDDESVRRRLGPERPIYASEARAEVLGALRWVAAVVSVAESDVPALVRELRPDWLLVYGGGSGDAPPGAVEVRRHCSAVEVVAPSGPSLSEIVERARMVPEG